MRLRGRVSSSGGAALSLTGTLGVGQTLTAAFGAGRTGNITIYRDGVAISGATANGVSSLGYVQTSGDVGHSISARGVTTLQSAALAVPSSSALSIAGAPVTTATAGTTYAGFTVAAAGGQAPYDYSVVNGPAGMVVSGGGQVTYPSPAQGTYAAIVIRATDALGATADLTFTLTVGAASAVPTNTVAPTITGTPQVGVQLNGVHGTWTGSPTSFAYQWKRGATVVATTQNYTPVSGDVGSPLTFSELASNATGPAAGYATSAATANVAAAAVSTAPRFFVGPANAYNTNTQALVDAATAFGASGSPAGSFALTTTAGNCGWLVVVASQVPNGIHITEPSDGAGGWSGAGLAGNNLGASPDPTTSAVTFADATRGVSVKLYRQDFVNATPSAKTYTVSAA